MCGFREGIVPEVNLRPIPLDEQRVNIFDEAEAKYWAKRFGCTRSARSGRHESWSDDQECGKGTEGKIRFDSPTAEAMALANDYLQVNL
jgi:hypothetical protein